MKLDKRLIHFNKSSRGGRKIRYIVIHDTGNPSPGADALAHFRYFGGGNRKRVWCRLLKMPNRRGIAATAGDATASPIPTPSALSFASIRGMIAGRRWATRGSLFGSLWRFIIFPNLMWCVTTTHLGRSVPAPCLRIIGANGGDFGKAFSGF